MARLKGGPARHHEVRGELTMTTVGGMDPGEFHSVLVIPEMRRLFRTVCLLNTDHSLTPTKIILELQNVLLILDFLHASVLL